MPDHRAFGDDVRRILGPKARTTAIAWVPPVPEEAVAIVADTHHGPNVIVSWTPEGGLRIASTHYDPYLTMHAFADHLHEATEEGQASTS